MNDSKITCTSIFKLSKEDGQWHICDIRDLNDGDIFKIMNGNDRYIDPKTGVNVWTAVRSPYKNKDGVFQIDIKKTRKEK